MTEYRRIAVLTDTSNVLGVTLTSAADGTLKPLISGRGGTVILVLPVGCGEASRAYVEWHTGGMYRLADWGARLVVVVTGSLAKARALAPVGLMSRAEVFADPEGTIGIRGPAALVVDEWGEVLFASRATRVERLPSPEDLLDWAVFVAIQCPECEGLEEEWKTWDSSHLSRRRMRSA